ADREPEPGLPVSPVRTVRLRPWWPRLSLDEGGVGLYRSAGIGDHTLRTPPPHPMKLRRRAKLALLCLAVVLASGFGYAGYLIAQMAPIGTAYAAKTLCSWVFVSSRPVGDVIREDVIAEN